MRCIVGVGTPISAVRSETLSGRCAETTVSSTMNDLCAELCGSACRLATGACVTARDRRRGSLVSAEIISFWTGATDGPLTKTDFFILARTVHNQVTQVSSVYIKFPVPRHYTTAFSRCG